MILKHNSHSELYDKPYSLQCPHCNTISGITLISIPHFEYLARFKLKKIGMVFKCDSCSEPIFLRFKTLKADYGRNWVEIDENYEIVEYPKHDFDFEHVPDTIKGDFQEALSCLSIGAYNAFASMCRRTIQSIAAELGAKGKSKVQKQINELKDIAEIDDETLAIINQIILDGHNGAHPHLPPLSKVRASILLELMEDVIYQLYIRKGKIIKASELRKTQIQAKS